MSNKSQSRLASRLAGLCVSAAIGVSCAAGQANPNSSAENAYVGSVQAIAATPDVKNLSLDDAIKLGIENNLALRLAQLNEKTADAEKLQALNYLMPNISLHGEHGIHQSNLAASGFSTGLITEFLTAFGLPAADATAFPLVVKVNDTVVQANVSQQLFTWSGWDAWKAAKYNERAAYYGAQSSRGLVVLNVGTSYLQAIADSAQIDYAQALLKTDEILLFQAREEHKAGTAANLDELRARVQYQTQQLALITAQNTFEKDKIALNRQIGLAPEQKIQLTDATPYADLEAMTIEDARSEAFKNRQDFQQLRQQMFFAHHEERAVKHERYPSVSFNGNYGVTGVVGQVYHGTFAATGTLSVPIFEEAKFRGDHDVAQAQQNELESQFHNLTNRIDQQLRDSMLDLKTAAELVQVSHSNVDLATKTLEQTTDRFQAGVDDNLPVVQAQSTLSQAQTQYVSSVLQFNQAKLGLARNLGIIDTQYQNFLGADKKYQGGK